MKLFIGDIYDKYALLWEEESTHAIKVLRLKIGDEISVTNGKGVRIVGKIKILGKKIEVENTFLFDKPKQSKLHIAIAPPKSIDRFEFFIEKSVELGIGEISPIITQNSERKAINKLKIQKQIYSACKQSLQSYFPIINPLLSLKEFINFNKKNTFYVAHCNENKARIPLHEIGINKNSIFFIGPEGDFSLKEIENFAAFPSTQFLSLGNNRLRTETAGIYIVSNYYNKKP